MPKDTERQLGNYRLIRLLFEGTYAGVYLGEHIHLNTLAAIKVLHTQLDGRNLEKFRKEAQIVARLRHPNIISIHDFDVKDGTPFLVMDYALNGTLRQRHPKGSRISPTTILPYLQQIGEALQYAHDERLVHRDIKPENMLIGERDRILLSDFGIATVTSANTQTAREVVGTISYMAPEQLRGKPCPASDQYSLGIVVYEWLCGNYPFHGSLEEVAAQQINTPPPSLTAQVPNLPPMLESVVMKALAKDPRQRHATITEFVYAFRSSIHSQPLLLYSHDTEQESFPDSFDNHFSTTMLETIPAILPPRGLPKLAHAADKRKLNISRRRLFLGLGGLAVLGLSGGAINWLLKTHPHIQSSGAPSTTPGLSPGTTPIPVGTTIRTYRGHHDIVYGVAWSPDSAFIASASADKTVQVWDVGTGGVNASIDTGHTDIVTSVAWSPDGKLVVSGSNDRTVRVWNPADKSNPVTYTGHTNVVNAVAWSPDGSLIASGGAENRVQVWNATDGSNLCTYQGHTATVNGIAWSPQSIGKLIASVSADKTVQVWQATDGRNPLTFQGHTDVVNAVAWSPDGSLIASAGADKTVRIWKATTLELVYTYEGHTDAVNAVAWSPDGSLISSASKDAIVHVWKATDGSNPYIYKGHTASVNTVAWLPFYGNNIASGSADMTVQIWEAT
jgi:WD40 repeat protein/tRNA A-37 threonylcarbamoyl transferase component Bud32